MLALVVARPGPVRDGLVALLDATPDIRKTAQIARAEDAWDFMQTICPEITVIHASPLSSELASSIGKMKDCCQCPLLVIVDSEAERKTALAQGVDRVVLEGLPSAKLAGQITDLLQQETGT